MKKIFAANWISAARAMAPSSKAAVAAFHPMRPGISAGARMGYEVSQSVRD